MTTPTPSDRPDLSRLTDAHVRALLAIDTCSDEDYDEAAKAGLVHYGDCSCTDFGIAIGAEAQRIADGLSDEQAVVLAEVLGFVDGNDEYTHFSYHHASRKRRMARSLCDVDLLIAEVAESDTGRPGIAYRHTPAGRLVLALRGRTQETSDAHE
jgi:hypothetical protein